MARFKEVWPGDSGPELFEWIAVTLILALAFLVLFQAIGPQLREIFDAVGQWLSNLVQ